MTGRTVHSVVPAVHGTPLQRAPFTSVQVCLAIKRTFWWMSVKYLEDGILFLTKLEEN